MSSDSGITISRRSTEIFLGLLERHDQIVLSRDLLRQRDELVEMISLELLLEEAVAPEIMIDVTDGQEAVELELDRSGRFVRYQCPETGRERTLPLHEVMQLRLNPVPILEELSGQLGIPSLYRRQIAKPLVPDRLWFIGHAKFGAMQTPIMIARARGVELEKVFSELESRPDLEHGLILFIGVIPDTRVSMPMGHMAVAIKECLLETDDRLAINRVYLDRLVTGKPGHVGDSSFNFDDTGTLTIGNRTKRFKGKQKSIISWFWQRRNHDAAGFAWADIKIDVQSRSDSLANAMGQKAGGDFQLVDWFEQVGHGRYRLLRR